MNAEFNINNILHKTVVEVERLWPLRERERRRWHGFWNFCLSEKRTKVSLRDWRQSLSGTDSESYIVAQLPPREAWPCPFPPSRSFSWHFKMTSYIVCVSLPETCKSVWGSFSICGTDVLELDATKWQQWILNVMLVKAKASRSVKDLRPQCSV